MPIPTMLCAALLLPGMPVALQDAPRISRPVRQLAADTIRIKSPKTDLGANEAKPTRSTKAPFAPITVQEKLGRVPADTEDVIVDGKQKVKYGDYKKWRNNLEERLNEIGFSLKDPGTKFKVRSANPDKSALLQQRQQLLTETTGGQFLRPVIKDLVPAAGLRRPGTVKRPTTGGTSPSTVQITKNFNKQLGGDNINLKLNADLTVQGKAEGGGPKNALDIQDMDSEFHLTARGSATGTLLKKTFELARIEGGYDTDKQSDTAKMRASLFVGGQQVFSENKTLTAAQRRGEVKKDRSVEISGQASIPVFGPFSVSAEFGIRGSAGIKASYNLGGSTLNGEVNPFVDVDGFAEGAVALGVGNINLGSVGAYANLTFAKFDMKLGANVGLGVRGKDVLVFENVYWHNNMELLSGEMGVFIKTPEVKVGPVTIFEPKTYETELFDFDGFKTNGFLLNHSKEKVVGQVAG